MILNPILPVVVLVTIAALFLALIVLQARSSEQGISWLTVIRRSLVVVLLFAVSLRPGIGEFSSESVVVTRDIDVFLVVDTTGSIAADDIGEDLTRLDLIKQDINILVEQYPGARFSLITFDSTAAQRIPLSTDLAAVVTAVNVLTPEITLYSHGSSITGALEMLQERIGAAATLYPERSRAIFYFGDGEQTSESAPEDMSALRELIVGGSVFGYGTAQGGRMLEQHGHYASDREREPILDGSQSDRPEAVSRIDEQNLRTIADQLGVSYHHRALDEEVPEIPIEAPEGTIVEGAQSQIRVAFELYWLIALAIIPLLLWEWMLLLNTLLLTRSLFRGVNHEA